MKTLLPQINQWSSEKKPFALARVIQTWGSAPRPVGSAMIVSEALEMAGSVSGGCVEGAVVKASKNIITAKDAQRLSFGVSDDEAWSVGLTCGGKIQVFLQYVPTEGDPAQVEVWNALRTCLDTNQGCVFVSALEDHVNSNTLITPDNKTTGSPLAPSLIKEALDAYAQRAHRTVTFEDRQYFVQVFPPKSLLLIIGAAHITADLVMLAKLYGFETVVIDPRGAFASNTVFPEPPDQILNHYPSEVLGKFPLDPYTYCVILSHDPKIDDNALHLLLRSNVAYIGALGSRKTHEKRMARLLQAGFTETEIARIEAPIGIDIHAQGAREIALSILGSLIKAKNTYL